MATTSASYRAGKYTETAVELGVTPGGSSLKCLGRRQAGKEAGEEYSQRKPGREAVEQMSRDQIEKEGRKQIRRQAQPFTQQFRHDNDLSGGFIHHDNPLLGHIGGSQTRFPTGGLPDWTTNNSRNLRYMKNSAEHAARHRYLRNRETAIDHTWHPSELTIPGRIGARALRHLFTDPTNPVAHNGAAPHGLDRPMLDPSFGQLPLSQLPKPISTIRCQGR